MNWTKGNPYNLLVEKCKIWKDLASFTLLLKRSKREQCKNAAEKGKEAGTKAQGEKISQKKKKKPKN